MALGQHDRDNENEPGKQKIEIEEVFIHPEYDEPGSPKKSYDVALLKLKSEAILSDTVKTVCLPELGDFGDASSFPAGMECYLTGTFFPTHLCVRPQMALLGLPIFLLQFFAGACFEPTSVSRVPPDLDL